MSNEMEQQISEFVIDRIADIVGRPEVKDELTNTSFLPDYSIDSVTLVNLIVQLEQKYDIFFEDEELLARNFTTVQMICDKIMDKLGNVARNE